MPAGPLAMLLGTLGVLALPAPPGAAALAVAGSLLACGCILRHGAARLLAWSCAGALLAAAAAHHHARHRWPESAANERVIALVIVESVPAAGPFGWTFDGSLRIEAPCAGRVLRARLTWSEPERRPRAGERWRLLLALRPPRSPVNPGTVDLERQLYRERIHALGTVVPSRLNVRIDDGHRPLTALRERIAERIAGRVADRDAAGLIAALAVGVTGGMSREQWRVFNATGTTHLVAISGLHVTMFALAATAVARRLWRIAVSRFEVVPREPFAALAGLAAATAYALLAGFSVPTQRTLLMLAAWLLARAAARACTPVVPLAAALAAVLIIDPLAPLAAGFWLSFAAIGAILIATRVRLALRRPAAEAAAVQLAVFLCLAPLTLAWFGGTSLAALVVNVVAIPVMSLVLVPLVICAVALMPCWATASDALLDLVADLHAVGWPWLAAAADWPFAMTHAAPPAWWYAAATVAVLAALLPWPLRLRLACVLWLIPLAAAGTPAPRPGGFVVTVLDAGASTAIVIRTAAHTLVYGTADGRGSSRAADAVLVPFLRSLGVRAVDLLVAESPAPSGSPGTTALLAAFPVQRLVTPGRAERMERARPCTALPPWRWDGVRFRFLPAGRAGSHCVLVVESPGGSVLVPGRIDREAEEELVRAGLPRVDAVIVPRQGSDAASSPAFVSAVAARWALLPGTRRGQKGTRPAVLRWEAGGTRVLASGDSGALHLSIDPAAGPAEPIAERSRSRRLWRGAPLPSANSGMMPTLGRGPVADEARAACGREHRKQTDVGNRAGRRPAHVADHSVLHRSRGDHPRAPLDAAGEARSAA